MNTLLEKAKEIEHPFNSYLSMVGMLAKRDAHRSRGEHIMAMELNDEIQKRRQELVEILAIMAKAVEKTGTTKISESDLQARTLINRCSSEIWIAAEIVLIDSMRPK